MDDQPVAAVTDAATADPSIRVGVVGVGFMGAVHTRGSLAAGASVTVCGEDAEAGRSLAQRFPGVRSVASFEALLDSDVDVIHVCTPNALHLPMAMAVVEAGKHVVCEKPLATTVTDAEKLVAAAQDHGTITAVPFFYRYYPTVLTARSRIAQLADNPLWLLHGSYLQDWLADAEQSNWRVETSAGGQSRAFADIGVHWCDLMEFVTGQRISRVLARFARAFEERGPAGRRSQVHTEDGGVLLFETEEGATGSLVVSQVSAGRRNRLSFSFDGPQESYAFDQEQPESLWVGDRLGSRRLVRDPATMTEARLGESPTPAGHPEGYLRNVENLFRDVHAAVAGARSSRLPGFADGLRAARITEAALTSHRCGEWTEVPA